MASSTNRNLQDETSPEKKLDTNNSKNINSTYSNEGSLHITSHKLVGGSNYMDWAKSVKLVICGRGKLGYINGAIPCPKEDDKTYGTWQADNSIVMAWLINSIDMEINTEYLHLDTAKQIWDCAEKMFSNVGNASQIFKIRQKLESGLNNDLDEARSRLVSRTHFPDLEEAFAEVRREEERKEVMMRQTRHTNGEYCSVDSGGATTQSGTNGEPLQHVQKVDDEE